MATVRPNPVISHAGGVSESKQPMPEDRLNLLVYAPPGTGKTFLAGTAEDDERTSPVLYCDTELGNMTIDWRDQGIQFFPINDFSEDMNTLADMFAEGPPIFEPTGEPFKTVVIDSLTEAAWKAMMGMIYKSGRPRTKEGPPNPDALEYGEWNAFTNKLRNLVMYFRDMKMHLIVTALERQEEGIYLPSLPGKQISQNLPAFFNTVARLTTATGVDENNKTIERRRLLLQKGGNYVAKDRSDRLGTMPRFIDDPTVGKLVDRIAEGRKLAREAHESKRNA